MIFNDCLRHGCHVAVSVWCLFLALPWVGLQFVNVAFPGYTHFFLSRGQLFCMDSKEQCLLKYMLGGQPCTLAGRTSIHYVKSVFKPPC